MWKVGNVPDEPGGVAETSGQIVKGAALFLPVTYAMWALLNVKGAGTWWLWKFPASPDSQSVSQFSRSVMSDSLWPHGLQHTRPPCPSPTPRACSNPCLSSWWIGPSNHLILCRPLFLLPSIFPSIRVFSNEWALCIRWPKYWSFNFISPSNEYSGPVSFRIDWFDLLAVQGTCKSLLQHHSSKASLFWCSALFMVQLSHSYVTTGKTIALTR